jgi:hypothetical protein
VGLYLGGPHYSRVQIPDVVGLEKVTLRPPEALTKDIDRLSLRLHIVHLNHAQGIGFDFNNLLPSWFLYPD